MRSTLHRSVATGKTGGIDLYDPLAQARQRNVAAEIALSRGARGSADARRSRQALPA